MQIYNTGNSATGLVKMFIYGLAGAGKTPLAATYPDTLLIATEPGTLSLRRARLPYVIAQTQKEAMEVINWAKGSREAYKFNHFFFDRSSSLSESILTANAKRLRDRRLYSPATYDDTMEVINAFLSIPKHLVMTCKALEVTEEIPAPVGTWKPGETNQPTLVKRVEPFCAVPKLGPAQPYLFDEVFYVSRHEGATPGADYSALRCKENGHTRYTRDRSSMLDLWEPADISHIIRKINGV